MNRAWPSVVLLLSVAVSLSWRAWRATPTIDARRFVDGLPRVSADLKLAVATMDLVKTVSGDSPKSSWGVDWGTTRAVVTVPARVRYAVDLSGPDAVSLRWDAGARRVTAEFPAPRVLSVELSSREKRTVVAPGWARSESRSGHALVDRLERELDDAVRADAESPRAVALAEGVARPALERLVADYAESAGVGTVTVAVSFRGDAAVVSATR
jgi:hypothetical protein